MKWAQHYLKVLDNITPNYIKLAIFFRKSSNITSWLVWDVGEISVLMTGKVAAEDVQQCLDELGLDMDGKKLHPESSILLWCLLFVLVQCCLQFFGCNWAHLSGGCLECSWVYPVRRPLSLSTPIRSIRCAPSATYLIYFLEATHALGWLRPESTCQAMFKHGLSVASRCPLWMHKCGEVAHRILHLRQRFESCLVYSIQVVLFYYKININIIQYKAHIISHVFTCTVAQSIYAIYSIKRGISRCYHGQVAYYILGMAGIPLRYCRWCYCWHGIQSGAKRQDTTWADLACF